MKSAIKTNRSAAVAGAIATLAVAAMGFAGAAQARENVYWSVGVGNVGSVYPSQPVYVQPQPVYVQPQPIYVQPPPVYYRPRPVFVQPQVVYGAPQPVYYGRHNGWKKHRRGYDQSPGYYGPGQGYAPVYYQRGDRRHDRDDD